MESFIRWIEKRRLKVTIILIVCAAIPVIFVPIIMGSGENALNCAYLTSQIVSSIFVVTGVIVGVWQYYITSKAHNQNIAKEQIERAIKMAEYYKDNVLPLYGAINFIFAQSGAKKLIKTAKCENMKNFNKNEIKKVFDKETFAQIKSINSSEKLVESILMADSIYNLKLGMNNFYTEREDEPDIGDKAKRLLIIRTFGADVIAKALNNLEYFASYFTHKVADESVVYQSLSPTYIELVELLYHIIAQLNDPNVAANYYTKVTELYRVWKKRQNEQQEEIDEEHIIPICKGSVVGESCRFVKHMLHRQSKN